MFEPAAESINAPASRSPRPASDVRDELRASLSCQSIPDDELTAHFENMPEHYWTSVSPEELCWHVQTVHRFFDDLVANRNPGTVPVIEWRHTPQEGCTRILVCAWDRLGLLTKMAGCLSALKLNILRADVFTRSDNLVLDVFSVSEGQRHVSREDTLQRLAFLIEGALSDPPRFASVWACHAHKLVPRVRRRPALVSFDNRHAKHTVMKVEADERLGLLHDLLQVLNDAEVNVNQAIIDTKRDRAIDIFHLTDEHKQPIQERQRLEEIAHEIVRALD